MNDGMEDRKSEVPSSLFELRRGKQETGSPMEEGRRTTEDRKTEDRRSEIRKEEIGKLLKNRTLWV
jgi:hypothetical protein